MTAEKVFIFDTTLRDGEQVPGATLNIAEKLQIAKQLARLRVDVIEAGFPISSPGDFEAVKRIAGEVEGPEICALARVLEEDIKAAREAIKLAEKPRIHLFVGTSDLHIQEIMRKNREEVLKMIVNAVRYARSLCDVVQFSPMDATRTEISYLYEVIEAAIKAGANIINIPDTVGYAMPKQFGKLICSIRENVPNINQVMISVHCHDDLGMSVANSITAIENGVRQIECTINGFGERAGNASLEEIVMTIKTRSDYFKDVYTEVNAKEIYPTSSLVSHLMGMVVASNKAVVGDNVFAHSSGIHQDGMIKNRKTFEIMQPEDVGISRSRIVLSPRSGRNALRHRLSELGHELNPEELEWVYQRFLEIADKKKTVENADLGALAEMALRGIGEFSVVSVSTDFDSPNEIHLTTVEIRRKDKVFVWKGSSKDGSIDAAFKAISKGIQANFELVDYNVQSVSSGSDAQARVVVKVKDGKQIVRGIGLDTDMLKASVTAFLDAIERAQRRRLEGLSEDFNPQMIGKSRKLVAGKNYRVPKVPVYGFLLVGVRTDRIAFFRVNSWKGGSYKSGSWLFSGIDEKAYTVSFPQYRIERHSGRHLHGLPVFSYII